MALNALPMPLETPLVNKDGTIEFDMWVPFFVYRGDLIQQAAKTVVDTLVAGTAAIGATPLAIGTTGGLMRVNLYARITRAATTSSSLTPTFRWTANGIALSRTYTAVTGNTTSTILLDTFPARMDANTALTYETAYASVGATSMTYSLEMAVERLV